MNYSNGTIRKIGLFILSLWILFICIILITINIPVYFGKDWIFVGMSTLIKGNIIPLSCFVLIITGCFSFCDFNHIAKGSRNISQEIIEIQSVECENLSFLTTYIFPLVCFNFDKIRYILVFLILLVVIGFIFIRTSLFYANPTLAILGFRIYRSTLKTRQENDNHNVILISRDKLKKNDHVQYIELDSSIYFAFKKKNNE